jgi:hypothetical protein
MLLIKYMLSKMGYELFLSGDLAFKLLEGEHLNNLAGYIIIEKCKFEEV